LWKKCLFDEWRSRMRQCQVFAKTQMMEMKMMRMTYYVHGAEKSVEEMIPRRFRRWMKVFEKKASE